ncbi:hypothetical protein FRC19_000179 [Serendipita sp. 401]|nr:hypothetical protein FRC15_001405 [Serendipita sp. 397]KAG8828791.1 hypothetical protein FRC19_000179 [Serendipita sp. 401]KAG8876503.1 hypothetical protein FRC20_001403 [Serendipita sp. 405]KAG9058686.1 hypothetical protein FS842_006023 [Serendipita sp. 407]
MAANGLYSSALALSTNDWLEQLTTDIPFLTIGIVALAALTCLLLTERLSIPASYIHLSAFLAFAGAIFDFARLLQEAKVPRSNSISTSNPGQFPLIVVREVNFSLSISLNYLFFFVYLGRPPRREISLVPTGEQIRARRDSPARWSYWGVSGYLLQATLGAGIVGVAVLSIIWRVNGTASGGIYRADSLLQGILSLVFLGKILLNTYLSPLTPRWKTVRDYAPVVVSLFLRFGIVITNEFCAGFSEAPLGRFLQAIQLYILIVFVLVLPYYGAQASPVDSGDLRRASSFRGLRWSTNSRWSVLPSAQASKGPQINNEPTQQQQQIQQQQQQRISPTQRLSTWLTSKLALPTMEKDPQTDRLWDKEKPDLEAPPSPGRLGTTNDDDDPSPDQPRFLEKPMVASWKDPYDSNIVSSAGASFLPLTPFSEGRSTYATTPAKSPLISLPPPPRAAAPAPPKSNVVATTSMKVDTITAGRFQGKFELRQSYESDSDSPVYGINGIIRRESSKKRPDDQAVQVVELKGKEKSTDTYSPSRFQLNPSKGFGRQASALGDGPITPGYLSGPGMSESLKSDFSLRDFPSPPGMMREFTSPETPGDIPALPNNFRLSSPKDTSSEGSPDDTESVGNMKIVDDVQFAMIPLQRPVVAMSNPRQSSFPTVVRESGASSLLDGTNRILSGYAESEDEVGAKRVRISGMDNRLDVTSFIGELTIPQNSRPIVQNRWRNDATESQLSPLPEDTSPRPSVEIVDMRFKSPTFTPAVTISTADKNVSKVSKVSFAPTIYDSPSNRSRLKPASPTNTLPSSPRPNGSPSGSPRPRPRNSFKPIVSSPLASPGPVTVAGSTSLNSSPGREPKINSPPGSLGASSRPIISGPMPLGSVAATGGGGARRDNYQPVRPKPQIIRTQRF